MYRQSPISITATIPITAITANFQPYLASAHSTKSSSGITSAIITIEPILYSSTPTYIPYSDISYQSDMLGDYRG